MKFTTKKLFLKGLFCFEGLVFKLDTPLSLLGRVWVSFGVFNVGLVDEMKIWSWLVFIVSALPGDELDDELEEVIGEVSLDDIVRSKLFWFKAVFMGTESKERLLFSWFVVVDTDTAVILDELFWLINLLLELFGWPVPLEPLQLVPSSLFMKRTIHKN